MQIGGRARAAATIHRVTRVRRSSFQVSPPCGGHRSPVGGCDGARRRGFAMEGGSVGRIEESASGLCSSAALASCAGPDHARPAPAGVATPESRRTAASEGSAIAASELHAPAVRARKGTYATCLQLGAALVSTAHELRAVARRLTRTSRTPTAAGTGRRCAGVGQGVSEACAA